MSNLIDRHLENNSYREVEKGEYDVSSTNILVADNLGTCLAVGIYDNRTSKSYLLHTATLENQTVEEEVNSFVDQIENDLKPPYEALAGGTMDSCYNPLTEEEVVEDARTVAENSLNGLEEDICIAWNKEPVFNRIIVSPERGILYDRPED